MEDKDKIIQEQAEEIKSLKRKVEILQVQNTMLENQKPVQEGSTSIPFAQDLFEILEKTKQEYDEMITELNQYKVQYKEQIKQLHSLKDRYIQEMDKVQKENENI